MHQYANWSQIKMLYRGDRFHFFSCFFFVPSEFFHYDEPLGWTATAADKSLWRVGVLYVCVPVPMGFPRGTGAYSPANRLIDSHLRHTSGRKASANLYWIIEICGTHLFIFSGFPLRIEHQTSRDNQFNVLFLMNNSDEQPTTDTDPKYTEKERSKKIKLSGNHQRSTQIINK